MKFSQDIPIKADYDVVVCGAGPAGCAAALSAAREGLSVLLVESTSQLGGMAVTGHVSHWLGGRTQEGEWVVGGLFRQMATETAGKGYSVLPHLDETQEYHPYGWFNWFIHGVPLDPYSVDYYLDTKMQESNVDVLFDTAFVSVEVREGVVTHLILHNCEGLVAVGAKAVIDATGNAEVAFKCGCPTVKGRPEDGKLAPASLIFHVYNVDTDRLTRAIERNRDPKFRALIKDLRDMGIWKFPYDIFICTKLTEEGEYYINTDRLTGIDPTDAMSLSRGYRQGRREIHELMDIFRKYFPGFEDVRLKSIAPRMGIRESRRILGDFVMTEKVGAHSLTSGDHGTTYGGNPFVCAAAAKVLDIFESRNLTAHAEEMGAYLWEKLEELKNVRVMAPCMAMGEAAGTASAEVVKKGTAYKDADISRLKEKLRAYGCIVDYEALPVIYPRKDQV